MPNNAETGYRGLLQVNVVNIQNNFPIQNARITISYKGDPQSPVEQVVTNSSGQTEQVALSAPPLELSLEPGDVQPYSEYNPVSYTHLCYWDAGKTKSFGVV